MPVPPDGTINLNSADGLPLTTLRGSSVSVLSIWETALCIQVLWKCLYPQPTVDPDTMLLDKAFSGALF